MNWPTGTRHVIVPHSENENEEEKCISNLDSDPRKACKTHLSTKDMETMFANTRKWMQLRFGASLGPLLDGPFDASLSNCSFIWGSTDGVAVNSTSRSPFWSSKSVSIVAVCWIESGFSELWVRFVFFQDYRFKRKSVPFNTFKSKPHYFIYNSEIRRPSYWKSIECQFEPHRYVLKCRCRASEYVHESLMTSFREDRKMIHFHTSL